MNETRVFTNPERLVAACARDVAEQMASLAKTLDRRPRLVLTGGRLGQAVVSELAVPQTGFDASTLWITWGDERHVPYSSPDSNSGEALRRFPGLQRGEVFQFSVSGNLPGCRDSTAAALSAVLDTSETEPLFDLVLLGIGEDGHVASLFPTEGIPATGTGGLVAAVADSPKPPAERLTLSLSALGRSRAVWFLAAGAEKQWAVTESMDPNGSVPASVVRGMTETRWYLDDAALPAAAK
jgi:6-phosphogluconolactonase